MAEETACRSCKESIKNGAKKCIHCDSYQNWRRFFDFSGIVLSLIIALISVLTVSIPIIKTTFEQNKSDVDFVFLEFKGDNIIKVASINRGNRDAVLKGASLEVIRGVSLEEIRTKKKLTSPQQLSFDTDAPLVEPQKIKFFDLYIKSENDTPEGLPQGGPSNNDCWYMIDFNLVAFDHKLEKKDPIKFNCP